MSLTREPAINAPAVVLGTIAAFCAIHGIRALLSPGQDIEVLLRFAFIPARYGGPIEGEAPGGLAADAWTFVTYGLLHGDITHLAVNSLWLLVFGSPVGWRFGATRFLAFAAVTAAAGAAFHLPFHWGEPVPMIGASAVVSGVTAAAIRFVFANGGPLGPMRGIGVGANRMPAAPLSSVFRNRSVVAFVTIWFAVNLVFGIGSGGNIAWQAHIGGFLAGLALFRWFDPTPRHGWIVPRESA